MTPDPINTDKVKHVSADCKLAANLTGVLDWGCHLRNRHLQESDVSGWAFQGKGPARVKGSQGKGRGQRG